MPKREMLRTARGRRLRDFLVDILRDRAKSSRCLYSRMPKPRPKIARTRPTKEVSVMAWIEDAEQRVLLVRQAVGLRLWTLPGGKVKRGESLVKALMAFTSDCAGVSRRQ